MMRKLAIGALIVSAISLSSASVRAEEPLPGIDLANSIINDLSAPLKPLLVADATPVAAPAAAPAAKGKHRGHAHHAKAHKAKHHVASRKTKHKAG